MTMWLQNNHAWYSPPFTNQETEAYELGAAQEHTGNVSGRTRLQVLFFFFNHWPDIHSQTLRYLKETVCTVPWNSMYS